MRAQGTGEGRATPWQSSGGRPGRVSRARPGRGGHRGPPPPAGGHRQGRRPGPSPGAPRGPARPLRAGAILLTNTNSLSVSYTEPRKSAPRFVLIYGTITIDSLHRHFEFVLAKNANRD